MQVTNLTAGVKTFQELDKRKKCGPDHHCWCWNLAPTLLGFVKKEKAHLCWGVPVTKGCTRGWVSYLLDVNSRAKSLDRLSCNALSHEKSVLVTGSFLRSSCNPTSSSSSSCTCPICLVSILQAQDSTQPICRLIQMPILQGTIVLQFQSRVFRGTVQAQISVWALRFQSRLYW